MTGLIACPHCQATLAIDPSLIGQVVSCPHCNGQFPLAPPAPPPQASNPLDFEAPRHSSRTATPHMRLDDSLNLHLGLAGSIALLLGCCCPAVSFPIVGGMSYLSLLAKQLQHGNVNDLGISAILALVACLAAFMLVIGKQFAWLWGAAIGAFLALGITLFSLFALKSKMAQEMPQAENNPFASLAQMAVGSIQPDFGLAIIAIGGGLLVAAATVPKKRIAR